MQKVYSVGQINTYIRNMFTQDFVLNRVSVRGEISNLKYHTSGHIYFTLKDASAAIACVMFAGARGGLAFRMSNGQQVVVDGAVNVYERDGKYQLYATKIRKDGAGEPRTGSVAFVGRCSGTKGGRRGCRGKSSAGDHVSRDL